MITIIMMVIMFQVLAPCDDYHQDDLTNKFKEILTIKNSWPKRLKNLKRQSMMLLCVFGKG